MRRLAAGVVFASGLLLSGCASTEPTIGQAAPAELPNNEAPAPAPSSTRTPAPHAGQVPGPSAPPAESVVTESDRPHEVIGLWELASVEPEDCGSVTFTFGDADGLAGEMPDGGDMVTSGAVTRVSLPPNVDLTLHAPARRAFWNNGAAIPVIEGQDHQLLVVNGTCGEPTLEELSQPARLILRFGPRRSEPVEVTTAADAFVIDQVLEVEPGRTRVTGWGAAFEAHAGVRVIEADGWWIEGDNTSFAYVRMGNPGVAWLPFALDIVGLPGGEYELYLDPCGGQCGPDPAPDTISFTVLPGDE